MLKALKEQFIFHIVLAYFMGRSVAADLFPTDFKGNLQSLPLQMSMLHCVNVVK